MKRFAGPSMGATLAAVILLGACAGVGAPSDLPAATVAPSASPLVTPTASLSASPLAPGSRWTWFESGISMRAVTAGGLGWVGVGAFAPPHDPGSEFEVPAAWMSVDGRTWDRFDVALPSGADYGEMTVVAAGPHGLVAAGTVGLASGIVWGSVDGRAWNVIGSGPLFELGCYEGCASFTSIAAGPAGIVVSGYRVANSVRAEVWASADGSAWRRVALPPPDQAGPRVSAEGRVAVTPGGFLAVGSVCRLDGQACRAVTWTSLDGVTWLGPTALPNNAASRGVRAVTDGSRIVVLGERQGDQPQSISWVSSDTGATWTLSDLASAQIETSWQGRLLTVAGGRFILIGWRGNAIEVWSSTAGVTWTREALEPGSFAPSSELDLADLAGRVDSALAIGDTGAGELRGAWISP